MWEQIRANEIKSAVIVIVMMPALMAVGYAGGSVVAPALIAAGKTSVALVAFWFRWTAEVSVPEFVYRPAWGTVGTTVAVAVWLGLILLTFTQRDRIFLKLSHARHIMKSDHPQLYNVTLEMTIAAQLPKMPSLYIIDDRAMNAFAVGRHQIGRAHV